MRALVLALWVAVFAGCATLETTPKASERPQVKLVDHVERNRKESLLLLDQIASGLGRISAEQAPGIVAFHKDFVAVRTAMGEAATPWTSEQVDLLTVKNQNYWKAWFEIHPRDTSLLLMRACLLMQAMEYGRAHDLLVMGTQGFDYREDYLHFWVYRLGMLEHAIYLRNQELSAIFNNRRLSAEQRRIALSQEVRAASRLNTEQWVFLELSLMDFQNKKITKGEISRRVASDEAWRSEYAEALEQIRRSQPASAQDFLKDQKLAAEFWKHWGAFKSTEWPSSFHTVERLAELFAELDQPEHALVMQRAVAAQRTFMAPVDMARIRPQLAKLFSGPELAELMDFLGSSPLSAYSIMRLPDSPRDVLPGLHEKLDPAHMTFGVREISRLNYFLSDTQLTREQRSFYLQRRADINRRLGRLSAALTDLDAVIAKARDAELVSPLLNRAEVLMMLGRYGEALATVYQACAPLGFDVSWALSAKHVFFAQGRFDELLKVLQKEKDSLKDNSYMAMLGALAERRMGQANGYWAKRQEFFAKETGWPSPLSKYFVGQIDRAALLESVDSGDDLRREEQLCQVYFVLGQLALVAGDKNQAAEDFENALNTGIVGFSIYSFSEAELKRLRPNAEKEKSPAPVTPTKPIESTPTEERPSPWAPTDAV